MSLMNRILGTTGGATSYEVVNPATSAILAKVPDMGAIEARAKISAAAAAMPVWQERTAKQRAVLMHQWFDLIHAHKEELASIVTAECGKPLAEARGEVDYGAAYIEWFAEEGRRTYGDVIPTPVATKRLLTLKQPVGVCAAITPWNFPIAMIARKAAPALAAGCTMVVKPAEATPLSALALAELARQAGIPEGVLDVVTAASGIEVGKEFCANEIVRKLSFTGSTQTGRILLRQCADTVKKVSMELGGNAPFIVFGDADLDAAVKGAIASKYRNSGQTCVCTNRFLVHSSVYDEFAVKFTEAVGDLVPGDGAEANVTIGPLINAASVEKVERHIADATGQGAKVLCGGKRHKHGGNFFEPTVLSNVTPDMLVAREESFGPLAPLFRFDSEAEALAMANDTEFGLASYIYTSDLARVFRVSEKLEYGMVGINEGIISSEVAPFGGVKQSGLGREGSRQGIEDYMETKYLCIGGLSPAEEA